MKIITAILLDRTKADRVGALASAMGIDWEYLTKGPDANRVRLEGYPGKLRNLVHEARLETIDFRWLMAASLIPAGYLIRTPLGMLPVTRVVLDPPEAGDMAYVYATDPHLNGEVFFAVRRDRELSVIPYQEEAR